MRTHKVSLNKVSLKKVGTHKVGAHKVGTHKIEIHKVGTHKVETDKIGAHKLDTHKVGIHRVGTYKVGVHKVDMHKVGTHKVSTQELGTLLCEYIDLKRESIIDPRNKKLAIVKNDPLGEVFNVDAFHKDQTTSLLKKQLIYAADANESDNLSDISENDNESASEFEEEYSMESMEEEIRPFQSKTSSGDSEPDSQQTLNLLHEKITDTENSADHEDNTTIEDDNFCKKKFEKKTKKTSWTCIGCPAPKPTWGWYCVECWRSRQEWLPKRKKLPYKTRRQRNKLRESRVNVDVQYTNSELCLFCCTQPKNTSFIHGKTGHQVCCYACAKNHWKKKATCPLCRLKIEKIVKIFTS